MKKLILLTFLMMMSLNCFSQTVTDSTTIQLKKPIVRLVIKDLIQGDSFKEELSLVYGKVSLLETKVFFKDSVISILNSKVTNFESITQNLQMQNKLSEDLNLQLKTSLKKQKIQTKLIGGIGIISVIGTIFILK